MADRASALAYPGFRQLAEAIDELEERDGFELLSVTFTDLHSGPEARSLLADSTLEEHPAFQSALQQELLRPYRGVALAIGLRDGEPINVLVLSHRSAADAQENVRRLDQRLTTTVNMDGQPWSAAFSSWEIEAEGETLIAILDGQTSWTIALAPTPLLFHE